MIPAGLRICESGWMRKGIEIGLGPGDRERLEAVIGSGNSPQKHVWRARIVLLSAAGVGTKAIQRQTGKGKPTIWRWQARFMAEGVDGLLHEATRPAGKPPLTAAVIERKAGVRAWLERHKRFHFHFTPTSASWLNAVEGLFAKLTRQRLKYGVFKGIVDLQAAINRFLAETNQNPKPFTWTADPDAIIDKVRRRGKQVLESIH